MITIHAALIICGITLHAKPFSVPSMNRQETFNEFTVMISGYALLHYTDYVPDPADRYIFGWCNIGIIALNLVVNLTIMMIASIHIFKLKVKRFTVRHSAKKRSQARDAERIRLEENKQTIIDMFPEVGTIFERRQEVIVEELEGEDEDQSESEDDDSVSVQELSIPGLPQIECE